MSTVNELLAASTRSQAEPSNVHRLTPEVQRDEEGFVDYSYINHVVINDAVLACSFGDPADDRALGILGEFYPGRKIIGIDARPLFARGGGIHCITQQQPSV